MPRNTGTRRKGGFSATSSTASRSGSGVGQAREEIDIEPFGAGGRNYGWRNREGTLDNVTTLPPAFLPLIDPIIEYGRTVGTTVIGGVVNRGAGLGVPLFGRYFYADFGSGRIWSAHIAEVTQTASGLVEHATGDPTSGGSSGGTGGSAGGSTSSSVCETTRPGADWVCVNGGWLPPNHPLAAIGGSAGGSTDGSTGGSADGPTGCTTVRPGSDWVCVNGGWVPPDHPLARGGRN